ncbi:hypothetical protein C1Y63_04500 [Corynebacterium sp. 13CS0277]|uniref:hypothetical protein n=1 Tax=Corynebacterium sp. 13CS0277 TaxID=2071994 RepID=UPI000D037522|nr:hypothetical protein [Corynebacterium sp. 13CS0277]PRQ11676.1 hypothetical protein C1Y63_04500 [Corynebacterium sp. 13CS0277]
MKLRRTLAATLAATALMGATALPAQADIVADVKAEALKASVTALEGSPCAVAKVSASAKGFTYYSDAVRHIKEQAKGTSLKASTVNSLANRYATRMQTCDAVKPDLVSGSSQFLGGSSDIVDALSGLLGSS